MESLRDALVDNGEDDPHTQDWLTPSALSTDLAIVSMPGDAEHSVKAQGRHIHMALLSMTKLHAHNVGLSGGVLRRDRQR